MPVPGGRRYGRFTSDNITDFYLEASRGRIVDVRTVHKFGLAPSIDTADGLVCIWDGVADDIGGKILAYN